MHRRNFLAASAATVGAGMLMSRCLKAEESSTKMRLSCSTIMFSSLTIEDALKQIATLGFDAVDIWSAHAGCPHLDDVLDRLGPDGLMEQLEANELDLYSFSTYKGGYAKYAALLGECGGGVAIQGSTRPVPADQLVPAMKQFLEGLKPLAELAEKYDSYLAIENHGNALLDSVDSLKAFTDLNDNPRLGIALAPYHIQRLDQSVTEAIRACGDQLLYIYMWQHAPNEEQLPGVGPTDMKPWVKALSEIEFKYPLSPFMHHEPEPEEMAKLLRQSVDYLVNA